MEAPTFKRNVAPSNFQESGASFDGIDFGARVDAPASPPPIGRTPASALAQPISSPKKLVAKFLRKISQAGGRALEST